MRGTSPSVNIYNLKALDEDGASSGISVGRAISQGTKGPDNKYGTEDDADIITMSIGRTTPGPATESAIENASKHATIIAASGNTNGGVVTYPAAYEKVLAVSSVDNELNPSDFSSRGPEIDIAAPGEDVLSTYREGYSVESGTSISAPLWQPPLL